MQSLFAVARQQNPKTPRRKDTFQRLPIARVVVANQQGWISNWHGIIRRNNVLPSLNWQQFKYHMRTIFRGMQAKTLSPSL